MKCHKTWNVIIFIGSIVFGLIGFTILLRMTLFKRRMLPILFIPIAYVIVKYVLHGGWDEFVASLILFWYLMYPQIVKAVITFFSCTHMIDGT